MLKLFDFECHACNATFEDLASPDELPPCKSCQSPDTARVMPTRFPRPFEVIAATTYTSGSKKAGTIHKFNRPREKLSVGWTPSLA